MMFSAPQTPKNDREGGFALVSVLFFLLLLAGILIPFTAATRTNALLVRNQADAIKQQLVSDNLIELAAHIHTRALQAGVRWSTNTMICAIKMEDGRILEFEYMDHAGLIDLNAANEDLLSLGFKALLVDDQSADVLAREAISFRTQRPALSDWRSGSQTQIEGGYKFHLFQSVHELSDFPLPRTIPADELNNIFTVHSKSGTVDRLRATGDLLRALNNSELQSIVSSGIRSPAVTITLKEDNALNTRSVSQRAFIADTGSGQPIFLEPSHSRIEPETSKAIIDNDPLCEEYFTGDVISFIERLMV